MSRFFTVDEGNRFENYLRLLESGKSEDAQSFALEMILWIDKVFEAHLPLIEADLRDRVDDEIMKAALPKDIRDTQRVKGWFVEGVRWAAGVARGGDQ